jgi:Uma2 family endonuclease
MNWTDVLNDPTLHDLPYKIELNEHGQIVMSPASNEHGSYQTSIALNLHGFSKGGKIIMACSIETTRGVKVADVAWASQAFVDKHQLETPYTVAPDLCIEVISPSNTKAEMTEKIDLYLARGAKEVWLCRSGEMSFFTHGGEMESSLLFPNFPKTIEP